MRIVRGMIEIGQPVEFKVYTRTGTMLMRRGSIIRDPSKIERFITWECYTTQESGTELWIKKQDTENQSEASQVIELILRLDAAFTNYVNHKQNLIPEISEIADSLIEKITQAPNMVIALSHVRNDLKISVLRTIQNTVFAILTAQHAGLPENNIKALACASLTQNLSILELQDELAEQKRGPTEFEHKRIRQHTKESAKILLNLGVQEKEWLQTVWSHHELTDGSGYPNQIKGDNIPELARILAITDRYGATVTPRGDRKAKTIDSVFRQFLINDVKKYDRTFSQLLIKEIGIYPPGATVVLNSGETALVFERTEHSKFPRVKVILDENGQTAVQPIERNTKTHAFKIRRHVVLPYIYQRNADLFWGPDIDHKHGPIFNIV